MASSFGAYDKLYQLKCEYVFTNILIAIIILCTIYVTAAEA